MMVGLFVKLSLPKVFFGESVRPPIKGDVLAKVNCQLSYRKKGGSPYDSVLLGGDWNHGILNDFPETVGNFIVIPTDLH